MSEQRLKVQDKVRCSIIRVRMIQQEIELNQEFDYMVKDKNQELQLKESVDENNK